MRHERERGDNGFCFTRNLNLNELSSSRPNPTLLLPLGQFALRSIGREKEFLRWQLVQ